MRPTADIPEDFKAFVIDGVERLDDRLLVRYDRRQFGGIMLDILPEDVVRAIHPGATIIVRYHTPETGHPGQVACMCIAHPTLDGWVEIYADWE